MFVDRFVLPIVSHHDDDDFSAAAAWPATLQALSRRCRVALLTLNNDPLAIGAQMAGQALRALGRSVIGLIAWRIISLLLSFF
jgi:hypothetical protein